MSGNRQFHRSFIIMKPWNTGYGIYEGKDPAGYCKLEIKNTYGKLQLYIQDMKAAESQHNIYDVILVSNDDDVKPVKITSIQIPDSGRGEYEINFEADNVQESGHNIEQYHGLAVVDRPLGKDYGRSNIRYPLVGYSDKRVELEWGEGVTDQLMQMYGMSQRLQQPSLELTDRSKKQEQNYEFDNTDVHKEEQINFEEDKDNPQESVIDFIKNKTDEKTDKEAVKETDEEADEKTVKEVDEEIDKEAVKETYIEADETNEADVGNINLADDFILSSLKGDTEGDIQKPMTAEAEITGKPQPEIPDADYSTQLDSHSYWTLVEEYYNRLFDNHIKVTPFDDAAGEVDWIRVESCNEWLHSSYRTPYQGYPSYPYYREYASYPYYRQDENRLDHYLVGLARNQGRVEYVVYGIPGIYSVVPPISMHGFSRWLPVKNGYGAGYWLLYIDGKTGNITYPY